MPLNGADENDENLLCRTTILASLGERSVNKIAPEERRMSSANQLHLLSALVSTTTYN